MPSSMTEYLTIAKQHATIITSGPDAANPGKDIITHDKRLIPYLHKTFNTITKHTFDTQKSKYTCDTVIYPGCATDILRPILITDATLFIGIDLVDSHFYPGLDMDTQRPVTARTKNTAELVHILRILTTDLKLLHNTDMKVLQSAEICNNTLTVTFSLFGKKRKVIIYVGVDANRFRPSTPVKGTTCVFTSSFTPNNAFFQYYTPLFIISPVGEYNADKPQDRDTITVNSVRSNEMTFPIISILDITNDKNPLLIAKADILKDIILIQTFEIHQVLQTTRKTRTRKTRKQ